MRSIYMRVINNNTGEVLGSKFCCAIPRTGECIELVGMHIVRVHEILWHPTIPISQRPHYVSEPPDIVNVYVKDV